jgi:small GTP-binding protein
LRATGLKIAEEEGAKVVIVGASGAGKTSILNQLLTKTFKPETPPTIGVQFRSYTVISDSDTIKLHIWDTAGQERFRSMAKAYVRNAVGALLVFDLTNRESFDELSKWIVDLHNLCVPNAYIIFVGNKVDLVDKRSITDSEATEFASRYNLDYLETSAENGDNVPEAFARLGQGILRSVKSGRLELSKQTSMAATSKEGTEKSYPY